MARSRVTSGLAVGFAAGATMACVPAFVPSPGTGQAVAGVAESTASGTPALRGAAVSAQSTSAASPGLAAGSALLAGLAMLGAARGKGAAMHAAADAKVKLSESSFDEPKPRGKKKKKKKNPDFDPAAQAGAMEPIGFFDPLGFAPKGKRNNFRNLRAMEIKHGRVAMLASVGLVVQHFIHRADVPGWKIYGGLTNNNGLGAMSLFYGPNGFIQLVGLVFVTFLLEFALWTEDDRREPGDFGNPLNIPLDSPDMRNKELSNGRFAMISVLAIWVAELNTGKDAVEQLGALWPF